MAGLAILIFLAVPASSFAQSPPPEIVLTVKQGPGPLDVTLEWTGGQPTFEVFRSADAVAVCRADTSLGVTDARIWIDSPPQGLVFYKIYSPFAFEPPEICNGVDDNCDGIVDNNTTTCNAGACEACIAGACRTTCGACDNCVSGSCQTRCAACETCQNGTCGPCNPAACQICVGGVCQSSCDALSCLGCVGGTCVSLCDTCDTCVSGVCEDNCDRGQCLSCQSGACRSFCDPVCQTCSPQGCRDNCGPCQRCTGGACHSVCSPSACEDCVDGMCLNRCNPSETCVSGVCQPLGSGQIMLDLREPAACLVSVRPVIPPQ